MKNINQCATCGQDLPPTGPCRQCTKEAETSAILMPLGPSQRAPKSRAAQISTWCGIAILTLTVCVGGGYAFHEEIANAIRGRHVADPNETTVRAKSMVDQTLREVSAFNASHNAGAAKR
jgi:hypothetical protein